METDPEDSKDSVPPPTDEEEPVAPVPTAETTPVWAQTRPVVPADDPVEPSVADEVDETLPPAAVETAKGATPDWSRTESSANGGAKKAPEWAQTVPTSPGEAMPEEPEPEEEEEETAPTASAEPAEEPAAKPGDDWSRTADSEPAEPPEPAEQVEPVEPPEVADVTPAPLTDPPKAVAADALKSTWPPRSEAAPAPAAETDIWPPEPPTERAMPAWPPPSEMEEPATPAQAIPSWPDSFDSTPAASQPPAPAAAQPVAQVTQPAAPPQPPAPVSAPSPAPAPATPAPTAEVHDVHADTTPPTEPETIPPAEPAPAAPAAGGAALRPAWAPGSGTERPAAASTDTSAPAPMQIPSWAPRVPLAAEPGTPTWFSPKEQIPHATAQPAAQPARPQTPPAPAPPVVGGQLPVAQIPAAPAPAAQAKPAEGKPTWQVVEQARAARAPVGPTAEDRSYAEWFAWAKRGGAPASACHAAAQGAFKALSTGKDVQTAVQWATAAMSRPPENVTYARQTYCAWFALANIDLNLDQHRAHAFAGAAIQALDAGQDASAAHAAGLAAAGIR